MSRNHDKLMAHFIPKENKKEISSPFAKFSATWYFDWWLPKAIYIIGFICILWKLFDITILGRFP